MKELILRNYETFSEIPEGFLLVKENSNLMYVRIAGSAFVAREFVDSVEAENDYYIYKVRYLNVMDNKNILNLEIKKVLSTNEVKITNQKEDVDIVPLNNILNIKGNDRTLICLEDIDNIVNYKKEFILGQKNSII